LTRSILLRLALPLALAAAAAAQSTLVDAMSQELARNFQALKDKAEPPPYFLSYEITQEDAYNVSATLGAIDSTGGGKSRTLDVSVRVGSPKLDNYHRVRGAGGGAAQFTSGSQITYEDNVNSIKHRLWEETDRAYRAAAERLIRIQTNTQVKVAEEDASADFSSAPPEVSLAAPVKLKFDKEEWTGRIRKLSARFRNYPGVLTSQVSVSVPGRDALLREHGRNAPRLWPRLRAHFHFRLRQSRRWRRRRQLRELRSGRRGRPAGRQDRAGGDRPRRQGRDRAAARARSRAVRGTRRFSPAARRACSFTRSSAIASRATGRRTRTRARPSPRASAPRCCPDFLSVIFDPTRHSAAGEDLFGWYDYDDEGVKAKPMTAVENGVLKTFLMSRSPIAGFGQSNGHGRRQPGYEVVSRQSNLIVESAKAVSDARLREMLIEEIKRQNKPYGLYFRDITNGFTTTSRAGLQAFSVVPVIVYACTPTAVRTNWCAARISWARRWRASPRSWPPGTSRRCSTATAARKAAAYRSRRCRRPSWYRKSKSKRRPKPTTGHRCSPSRRAPKKGADCENVG
jgi:TldD protein